MACPICGAKCVCRRRGEGGICCECHHHTARARRLGIPLEAFRDAHRDAHAKRVLIGATRKAEDMRDDD
jgi:hypothetical protein